MHVFDPVFVKYFKSLKFTVKKHWHILKIICDCKSVIFFELYHVSFLSDCQRFPWVDSRYNGECLKNIVTPILPFKNLNS